MKKFFLRYPVVDSKTSFGLLIFRVALGIMMLTHGIPKLMKFNENLSGFRDPLGVGSTISFLGTVFGEVICASAIILGLYTRLSAVGLGFVMAVAGLIVHADDPFTSKEKSLLFLTGVILILFTGPGKYSLDKKMLR